MLITTSATLGDETTRDIASSWVGPHVLISLAGVSWRHAHPTVPEDWIIVEAMDKRVPDTRLFCQVMERVSVAVGAVDGPLLYLAGAPRGADWLPEALGHSGAVLHEQDAEGRLAILGLGSAVTSHPLFWEFFKILRDQDVDAPTFMDLLHATLAWGAA